MTNKKDTEVKTGHDWDSTPDVVNAEGTKFWKDHSSTNYATAQGLKDAVVWITEAFADGYRTRLLIIDGQVVADEQSVEALGVKIDILAFQLNNPTCSVTFDGKISGDMECFCWDDVPTELAEKIVADPEWVDEDSRQRPGRVYPNNVLSYLGVEPGKRYKFTVTAEPIED